MKQDVGAFVNDPAWQQDGDGGVATLVGHPHFEGPVGASRAEQLSALVRGVTEPDNTLLPRATGVFAAVVYKPERGLWLITDKLGVRPVYYTLDDERLVFASQLRILEEACENLHLSVRGVMEAVAFGFPLARRTPYHDVHRLYAAEQLVLTEKKAASQTYWDWAAIRPVRGSLEEHARELGRRFRCAVAKRRGADTVCSAFLSGGLDSRSVVATLREQGAQVYSYGFGPAGSLDEALAEQFAARAGAVHRAHPQPSPESPPIFANLFNTAQRESTWTEAGAPERPRMAWSGDGGSVGMGHAYIHKPVADLLQQGDVEEGVRRFVRLQETFTPRGIVARGFRDAVADIPTAGILAEMRGIGASDPLQAFYLFLLLNDQRHHLDAHFEHIHSHQLEFQLPFFDSSFMEAIMVIPVEKRLYHRLYNVWLATLAPAASSVPWQSYPGHEPCPLSVDSKFTYQWDTRLLDATAVKYRRLRLRRARAIGRAVDFPKPLLSRARFLAAMAAYQLRLRDYSYLVASADIIRRFSQRCGGRVVMD